MTHDEIEPLGISEDNLQAAQPFVRAQTVQRYEDLYRVVTGHLKACEDDDRPLDPRYLEIGIRILKEESILYRLARPPVSKDDDEDPSVITDAAAQVEAQLLELEDRLRGDSDQPTSGM